MKKWVSLLFVLAVVALVPTGLLAAGHAIKYSVAASTTNPTATVTQKGSGLVVVIFTVPSLDAGGTFSFQASMTAPGGKKVSYPVVATLSGKGKAALSAAFDPVTVSFPDGTTAATSVVTLTLPAGTYHGKRMTMHIQADPASGSHIGKGAGVKVVLLQQKASAAAVPEEQSILQDVTQALAPQSHQP